MKSLTLPLAGLAGLLLAPSLAAQGHTGRIILDSVMTAEREMVPLQLEHRSIYLLTVTPAQARPVFLLPGPRPDSADLALIETRHGDTTVYEVYPPKDAAYQLSLHGPTGLAVHVRLTSDSAAIEHRVAEENRPRWRLGVSARGGYHGGYLIGGAGETDKGGGLWEACLATGNGKRISGCLGVAHHGHTGDAKSIFWFFIEPRFALLRSRGAGQKVTDVGVQVRMAQGNASRLSIAPVFIGGGLFLSTSLSRDARGRGISLELSTLYGALSNINAGGQSMAQVTAGLTWIP